MAYAKLHLCFRGTPRIVVPNDAARLSVMANKFRMCKMIAVSSLQELDLRQHVFMSNAVLEHPKLTQSLEAHFAREPIDILTTANACALQCSSLTVSTASACGDCNVPVTRTFLPRNFFRREILVNRYAWGLDSSVRKNMWLQSTIVPTTFRCTSPSEPLERPSEQSAISEGAVAS